MTAVVFYGAVLVVFCACGATAEWLAERRRHRRLRRRINQWGSR